MTPGARASSGPAAWLAGHTDIREIVGDILKVRVADPEVWGGGVRHGDLATLNLPGGGVSLAQVIAARGDVISLQVFSGAEGVSTGATVHFLGHPMRAACSRNILGRVFDGAGAPIDGGPDLSDEPRIPIQGPTVNPVERVVPKRMIRTDVPMIDVFNTLVESQKIPIFSISGQPYDPFLARIGVRTDADIVVFGGMGLIFDDFYAFRRTFEDAGVFARTVMFVNQASDPIAERLIVPDMALAVAERIAVEEGKRVLVLLTDMTAFADALKEIGIAADRLPSTRGHMGDLYSQLARRYEKACDFAKGGSLTILSVTTMPGDDVTHPVPDNTGYITEGQFYLHDGVIDPFGSLSRQKQNVVGKTTREDHGQIMNAMIRLYSEAGEARKKLAMAFDLTARDRRLLRFGELFRNRFMGVDVTMALEDALDLCWRTLAECFAPEDLLIKRHLVETYYPKDVRAAAAEGEGG